LNQSNWKAPINDYPLCAECLDFFDKMHPINRDRFYGNDPANITKIETKKVLDYTWFMDQIQHLRIKIEILKLNKKKDEDDEDEDGEDDDDSKDKKKASKKKGNKEGTSSTS